MTSGSLTTSKRPAPTRWYWVRHAPVIGAQTELYDTHDEPADVSDTAAFAGLTTSLPQTAIWLTSDLQRAMQTADAIATAGYDQGKRTVDPRLAEQDFGDWFGRGKDPALRAEMERSRHNFWMVDAATRPPNGESFIDLMARVAAAIAQHNKTYQGQTIIAVAHGGVIRAALAYALGLEPDRAQSISIENLSTTRLDYLPGPYKGGDWRTVFVNKRPV